MQRLWGATVPTRLEQLNDRLQQAASSTVGKSVLASRPVGELRLLCDLNYLNTEGSKPALIQRLLTDRFGDEPIG